MNARQFPSIATNPLALNNYPAPCRFFRQRFTCATSEMVHQRGGNSNRIEQLQGVIKNWVEIYKSPPQLDSKTFRWKPITGEVILPFLIAIVLND